MHAPKILAFIINAGAASLAEMMRVTFPETKVSGFRSSMEITVCGGQSLRDVNTTHQKSRRGGEKPSYLNGNHSSVLKRKREGDLESEENCKHTAMLSSLLLNPPEQGQCFTVPAAENSRDHLRRRDCNIATETVFRAYFKK